MSYTTIQLASFRIIGISTQTSNANGQAQQDIGQLWEDWFNQGISDKIPHKLSNEIYNVYTDYESDHNGPYTCILGHVVRAGTNIPTGLGLVEKTIQGGRFALYQAQGKLPDIVLKTWTSIWEQNQYERLYRADFDVYETTIEGGMPTVKTYVSIV